MFAIPLTLLSVNNIIKHQDVTLHCIVALIHLPWWFSRLGLCPNTSDSAASTAINCFTSGFKIGFEGKQGPREVKTSNFRYQWTSYSQPFKSKVVLSLWTKVWAVDNRLTEIEPDIWQQRGLLIMISMVYWAGALYIVLLPFALFAVLLFYF